MASKELILGLREYELKDIVSSGKVLGIGTYCCVSEVLLGETVCVAKTMHPELVDFNVGVDAFIEECRIISKLQHPNIVTFIGLHWPAKTGDDDKVETPWIILEYLSTDLSHFLNRAVIKPTSVKVSILLDVSKGLLYLHSYPGHFCEYIVHCDLSSFNVLLNDSLTAKICDFGKSLVVTSTKTEQVVDCGAYFFMPPEANVFGSSVLCSPTLDVFSYGVIILHTITETLPGSLALHTFQDSNGKTQTNTSIEQRAKYYGMVDQSLDPSIRLLNDLSKHCLNDDPKQRPTTNELVCVLEKLKDSLEMDELN